MSGARRVEFEGVFHFYEPGTDIKVKIKKTPDGCEKRCDWVGIFPVGWKSLKEFVTFVYVKQMDVVIFHSASLPFSLSDSFYQFVYVSADSHVLATSIPFQFQIPYDDSSLLPDEQSSDEVVVMVKRRQDLRIGDLSEQESASQHVIDHEVKPLSESSQVVDQRTTSAPPSGFYSVESRESLKRERDEYMKQFHHERKVTEMQEEKYLELQSKLDCVITGNQTLSNENEVLRLGNLRLNDEVIAAQRDNAVLDREVKRLGGLVANLSRQNRYQSEKALACQPRKLQLGEKEGASLLSQVHITRPPPYHPPGDDTNDPLDRSEMSNGDRVGQAVGGSADEDCFECPMCEKKLPKSIGPTAFQMHVNLHFH